MKLWPRAEGNLACKWRNRFLQMEPIKFTFCLLLLLMLLATQPVRIIADVSDNAEAEDADLESEDGDVAWQSEGRDAKLSSTGRPFSHFRQLISKPPRRSVSNCPRNDTNVAACCKLARTKGRNSDIQCCKYNGYVPIGVTRPFGTPTGCADLKSDPAFCGSCTTFCQASQACCNGKCIDTCCNGVCPTGQTCCNDKCVNLRSDELNCGICGVTCGTGEACCNAQCIDIIQDELNCGTCGQNCADRCCNGVCYYTFTDPNHCGGCDPFTGAGRVCPPDMRICCGGDCYNSTPTDVACVG